VTTRLQPGVAAYSRIYASAGARPTYLWEGIIGMLIEFSVADFRSILSRQTLGLGANAKDSHLARNVPSAARTSAAYFGPPLSMVRTQPVRATCSERCYSCIALSRVVGLAICRHEGARASAWKRCPGEFDVESSPNR